jgi:uncharacterized damage-inducible protein DinB
VVDHKPPRSTGTEAEVLRLLLGYQRESFTRKLEGVDEAQALWSPVRSGTTLLWLANHMADAEHTWILHRFAGGAPLDPNEHRTSIVMAIERYRVTCTEVDGVIDGYDLDEVCRAFDDQSAPSLRWVLGHLLQETSRHAGHVDILRELIDGTTGR